MHLTDKLFTTKRVESYIFRDFRSLRQHLSSEMRHRKEEMSELMKQYLQMTACRRVFILKYFEGNAPDNVAVRQDCCDVCKSK